MANITAQQREWQAESDARTLAEAQVISKDTKRLNDAIKKAKAMAAEKDAEAKAMKSVAKKSTKRKK